MSAEQQYPWHEEGINSLDIIEYLETRGLSTPEQAYVTAALETEGVTSTELRKSEWDVMSLSAEEFSEFTTNLPRLRDTVTVSLFVAGLVGAWEAQAEKNDTRYHLHVDYRTETDTLDLGVTSTVTNEPTVVLVEDPTEELIEEQAEEQPAPEMVELPAEAEAEPQPVPEIQPQPESLLPTETLETTSFLNLLAELIEADDDEHAVAAVKDFAKRAEVAFAELPFAEEELTHGSNRVDIEISQFIESNTPATTFELITLNEAIQLKAIYNPNNLLAFTKDILGRAGDVAETTKLDMIYRYRTILRRLDHLVEQLRVSAEMEQADVTRPKDGARTWGGDIHPYGYSIGGIIDPKEYRDFSEDVDEPKHPTLIDGQPVKWILPLEGTPGLNYE